MTEKMKKIQQKNIATPGKLARKYLSGIDKFSGSNIESLCLILTKQKAYKRPSKEQMVYFK